MQRAIVVGLIGSGIQQSLTPAMHEREGAAHGIAYAYRLIDLDVLGLSSAALPDLLLAAERMGLDGLNITYPCKQTVIPLLDELSEDARNLGAVNTVVLRDRRRIGHNTDWWGFAEAFKRELPSASLGKVVLLGAGGAGSAVAHALLTVGAQHLIIVEPDRAKAAELESSLERRFGQGRASTETADHALPGADGIVNATPIGMAKHPGMALDAALIRPLTGWRTSSTFPSKPSCCVMRARSDAAPWAEAEWRSFRPCGRSNCSPGGRPMLPACSTTSGTFAPRGNEPVRESWPGYSISTAPSSSS
jgi:shikimate dehydrogenase